MGRELIVPMWSNDENELRAGKTRSEELRTAQAAEERSEGGEEDELEEGENGDAAQKQVLDRQSFLNYVRPLCDGERAHHWYFCNERCRRSSGGGAGTDEAGARFVESSVDSFRERVGYSFDHWS